MSFRKWMFCLSLLSSLTIETVCGESANYWQNLPSTTQDNSLLFHSWSIYSRFGEEGVLDEVLKRIDISEGTFVEFSSSYDTHTSNVRFLADRGWSGLFVDVAGHLNENRKRHQYIVPLAPILCLEEILYFRDIAHLPQVHFINDDGGGGVDQIVNGHFLSREIDVLSIDIAGLDDVLLEGLEIKPKVILVKAGLSWTPFLTTKIPLEIALDGVSQPLPILVNIAKNLGYTPVCYTGHVVFVRDDLLAPFEAIEKNSVSLWMDSWYYYSERLPAYISWIRESRNSNAAILQFDLYPLPSLNH